jgi:DNA-binding winged helix-turn-helix (wHTH) protein
LRREQRRPAGTFVDFESCLSTVVNRLRIALGDTAENPRYIETLSRSGYRFIATVISQAAEATAVAPRPDSHTLHDIRRSAG